MKPLHRILLLTALIGLALGAKHFTQNENLAPVSGHSTVCDLNHTPCSLPLLQGKITLNLTPRPIPALQAIDASVHISGLSAERVSLEIKGADMDMGPNQSELHTKGDGLFSGKIIIPACSSGHMAWRAKVEVEVVHAGQTMQVYYDFSQHH